MSSKRARITERVSPRQSDPIDHHVGSRIRKRRVLLGLSQERFSAQLGLTFQQIQKYEMGINRIGASRLYEISRLLAVPIQYFYDDMPMEETGSQVRFSLENEPVCAEQLKPQGGNAVDQPRSREVQALVRAYYNIPAPTVRKQMLGLINSLAAPES